MAWGAGLLTGPALAGFIFERRGFAWLTLLWAPMLLVVSVLLARVQSGVRLKPATTDPIQSAVRRTPDTTGAAERQR
jgi:MFS family permease